ncbi:hypothetical protein V3C99_005569 [Haemonchus contortus]
MNRAKQRMGKDGDPGGQAMSPKDPKMQAAKVRLLDGTYKDFSLHRGSDGEALFVLVSADLSIEEREYFSLCFYDTEGTRNWLYNDKKILRQLKGLPWEFCYEVKFYPTAPSSLNDDHARYNLFLQLRNDVCSGRLPATIETHATLGALVAQAQYGDAKPTPEYEEYLRTTKFAPQNSEQLLQMIAQKHKEHKGLTPAEAENLYLDTCKQQTMYGIFVFNAKDSKGAPVGIGICAHGIYIYKDQIRVNRFPWQGIIKISYRKNQFAIKLKAGEIDKKEATVVYKVSDYAHAKRIWKTAVEHHTFFRLIQPDEKPKSSLFRWGSARFRYQGRTQFQTKMASQMFDKPSNVTVQRTSSARLTHSLDNVAKEQVGSDHVSPLHYADNELGSREPMASPAVTYEISGQSEKRKLDDKVGNGLPSDDDDELVYTPVESPSSAAYYLSERSSAYSPTTSNDFGRSHQTRLTPLYSWKGSEIASTSADGARYSYNETTGSYSLPYRSGPYSSTFVDTTEKRADIEPLPINDTVQVYHAGHYQRLDRQPRRPPRNADLNNQRINGVTTVRRLGPEEEMNMHPIRYFVNVQHSGSSHIPRVSRIRHPGREEVGAPNLSNYNFRSSSDSPIVRLEPGNELEARNIRQYSSVYHPGSSQIVVSKQSDPEMPPPRLITRVLPTASLDGHFRPLSDGDGVPKAHISRAQRNENIDGTEREQFSTPSTSPAGRFKESSRERIHDSSYSGKGEAILVGRRQHDSTEEAIEKKRARPEVYGVASTSSTRHVEPITPHSELPSVPLGEHTQAYHHGQSWDVTKGAKAHIDSATNISSNTGKKAVLHLKGSPVKKKSSPADEEEAPEVCLIARVPHKVSEGKTVEAERKYRDRTHQGEIHSQHPVPDEVAAPLQHVDRQAEIEQMPFRTASTVPSSTTTSKPTQHRAYVFERYHHHGGEEFAGKEQLRPADHGVASKSDKGSLESTPRQLELKTTPLREHAEVYHHGQSWVLNQGAKTVPAATTEDHHGTTRREVPHTGGTVVKSMPSSVAEEETSKIHLITRIPPATAEQTTNTVTPSRAHELTGMYSVSKPETQERHASSLKYSDHPNIGKSTFATDYTDRQVEFKQIPLKVSTAVTDKPAADMGSQPVQHRAYVFGRWRHDGDEEVVEKDQVRPESYRVVTTSYKGPLESTTLHSELPSAPLRDHAKVYHHGQSWDLTKTVKTPTTSTTEVTGKKAVLHLKGTPEKDMPSPSVEEGAPKVRLIARVSRRTSEDDEVNTNKPMKEHKSSGLFSFWKSGSRKRRVDLHDGSEYPITGKYAGPLDQVNRQRDIEQIPFKAPTPVTYKPTPGRGSETAQHRAYVFGRWRHDGDEEIVEKDRVRPETYGVASTSYKGPLESTTLHSELPSAPLRDHAKVYHLGQSWDMTKTAKTPTTSTTEVTGKKAVLHLKGTPEKDMPSPSADEEAPKVRLIARVPHRTSEDDEALTSKPTKDHESSGLFSFWKSGERKHRGQSYDGSEYPITGKYAGPLDEVNRERDIEQIPFKAPTPVTYKPTVGMDSEAAQHRAYVFGRWRHDGDEEIVEKDRVRPETYGVASTSYKGPLESTTLHSELPSAPLRDHAKVYHHGHSWDVTKSVKTPTTSTTEVTGKKAVLHLKGTPEKDMPSPSVDEEAPKVRLIARVPHRTSGDDEALASKPTKDHESSGLFSFWKSGERKHRGQSYDGSEYPITGKYAGPLDEVNRERDIEQIPFKAPTPVTYKPTVGMDSEPAQHRAYVFGRWRHDGDEEIVEKDRVRPETYGVASTSYKGPLESTTLHSELPSAPLRDHAKVYHHGQSWDMTKTVKTPTTSTTEVTGKKAVLHLKGTPEKDMPSPSADEEAPKVRLIARLPHRTSEDDEALTSKPTKDHESSGLFSFWKSGERKHRGQSYDGSEYPITGKYAGPLDEVNRQRDIEQIPFKAPTPVTYKPTVGMDSEPAQHRAYVFGRWRHDGDEEIVEKDRVRPETYGVASTSYKGPLESTTLHSELPSAPLRDHAKVYHHGQSWDVTKTVKTPTTSTTEVTGKKAVLHLKGTPEKDMPSPSADEEAPKVRLIARVPHRTSEDDEALTSKPTKDHESSGLFSFWKSGERKHRGDSYDGSEHPITGKYAGALDEVNRQRDIEQIPFKAPTPVTCKPTVGMDSEPAQHRAYVFGRWRHDGDEEIVEKDRVRPETYGVASTSYKGPLESTTLHSELPSAPLRDHAKVYHHGQSWDVTKTVKTPTTSTTEVTGKKAVLHLKGTPERDMPSPSADEEAPKVRLIARVPHRTSEDDEALTSKPTKDHESSGLFSFWKSGERKHRGQSYDGSEYPITGKYAGPLDEVNRERDIEQIPFKAPTPVTYKPTVGMDSEPAQHRAYVFGRWRHDGDEEIVEKDRVRPETYGVASTSYKGPLESTTLHSELPSAPLRDHAKVYHHGQSWDVTKTVKTPTTSTTEVTGKKAVLHLKGTPEKDMPSPSADEEAPKVRLIARLPHRTSEDDEALTSKPTKDHESSGLFSFWKSGERKHRGQSYDGSEYPITGKYAGPLDEVNRERDIEQIPFKAPTPVTYKPTVGMDSEPAQHRAYVFGRWRHDGDEEIVEKDRVRPETYGVASTSYKGPLESTTLHSELPSAPLRDHAKVYHHGQSWDVTKTVKTPTTSTTEVTGKKAVLHLKGTPEKDMPSPSADEEAPKVRLIARVPHRTSEDDEALTSKPTKDHESSGLFSFWKSGERKHRGQSYDGSEYPITGKYAGPLDEVNRQRDIEQIPFKAPTPVTYKPTVGMDSEPAQHRAYVFGRWRHDGDEEIVEKDRVRPETYGVASTSYKGPLESTTLHSELPSAPLRDHAKVYHHGQSWDVTKTAKTPTTSTTEVTGKKAVLHLKGTPEKDMPSPSADEEAPKVRLIARVPHRTSEDDEALTSKPTKDHESSGLFSFWKSGERKHRGQSYDGSEYPITGKYAGPLDEVNRQRDIEQIPFKAPTPVTYKPTVGMDSEPAQHRAYVFGRWRHDGDEEIVEKDRVRPETYGVASTSYKGPLESTTLHSELPSAPLRDHAKVYHHGQSWDVTKTVKTPTTSTTEVTGKKAVLHLKGTPEKDMPSPSADEEAPKVRLIARVPHRTSEDDEALTSKPTKDHESSGLFSFWKSGERKHRGDSYDGSEHPITGKYAGPLDEVNRQRDIEQIPFKAPTPVTYKPTPERGSETAQHRAYVFGRWRHDGDEEIVEKDRVRPETYGVASTSYKGPLESTTLHSELPSAPLRDHAKVYHHGQSWDVTKTAKTPTTSTTEVTGKKAVLHLKGTPEKDMPSPSADEEAPKVRLIARVPHRTSEDDEALTSKPTKDHESSGLFSFWKSGERKHRGQSYDGSEYPITGKYAGPLDEVNRQRDIEQIPFKAPTPVTYKPTVGMDSEPAQHRAYVFGRWRHDGDEEIVEKDRVRPETYGVASTSYKGPLESTTLHSELPSAPLRDHAKVYHHGQSWDVTKTAKTPTTSTTEVTGKKAVLHLKGTPEKDMPSPSADEEAPKVRLIARVPHRTSEDDEALTSKPTKDHESSGLFSFWKSGERKHRGQSYDGSEYPITGKYAGPLDEVNRQRDIEQIPFKAPTPVTYKPTVGMDSEPAQHRAYVFGRWRHDGDEEIVEKDRVRPETYGVASTSYKGPLESTTLHSELPSAPLRDHAKVYHHGQSWDVTKTAKTPTTSTTEVTGKKAVLHLKGTPEKDMPSPSADEEAPKVRLIARVPHRTSEDDEALTSKPTKDHESSGLFSFWKSGERKHRGDLYDGSEHPITGKYAGPLDEVNRQRDIEQIPFKAPTPVTYKPTPERGSETAQHRAYVFGRWRHDGDEEVVEKDRVRPETYGVASTSYKGPLESTTLHSELPSAPLRDHAKVYHHGQSWDVTKIVRTPTTSTTEVKGKKAVLHLKGTPEKDMPSPSVDEEAPKVRLIARVPHRTSEDDEALASKPTKDHESSGLFSFWKSGERKHRGQSYDGSEYPITGKYAGPLDEVNRQRDIEQIPFKAPTPVTYKPTPERGSETAQHRAYVFGRWRHDGDEEIVEKDRVRPETYGVASTSYKGPLESTTLHSELPSAPLRDHAKVYHHGQSWDVAKTAKTPTAVKSETDHGTGRKAVLHLKRAPEQDMPSPSAEEEAPKVRLVARVPHRTSEDDEAIVSKPMKDHKSSGLFSFWKSGGRKHGSNLHGGSEYPFTGKYAGPLDEVNRQRDIEQIPFKAPTPPPYKPASGTTSERKQLHAYVFERQRHGGDEEIVEKDRVRPETYGLDSTSHEGTLESTSRHSELPSAPLRELAQVYHRGQSWDVTKTGKTPTAVKTGVDQNEDKKAALHLRGPAVKEELASAHALNAEKYRGFSGLSPSTSGGKTDSSEQVESRSSSRPFAFWKSGSQKREEAYEGPEHLSAAKNDEVQETIDRYGGTSEDRSHISSRVSDRKILAGSSGSTNSRTYLFRRWRRGDSDEVVEHYEIGPATSTSSTSYEGFSELAGCPSKYSSNLKDDIHATLRGQAESTVSNAASSNKDGVIAQERSEDRKHPSWTRSWDVQRPTIHKEAVTSYLHEDSSRHDLSTDPEHAIPVACSHTGRLEGRTVQGDEWVEVRVDRRAEVQLEPVLCLTGAGLRDLSEDEAGMIFSVTPPMPSSDRSFFSRLGFKSSAQKPKKQKKGKKETDSSDSSSSSEDEKNQIQVIPVESGGVTLPHYVDPDEKDGRVVRRETNELKYRLKGEGISPKFDPQNPESGQPHTTISTWQESSRLPDEVTTEYDEKGNKITRTLKTSQVKHTVQKQTFQNYVVPTDEQPGVVTVEHIREETTPLSAAAVATNGSAGSPHVVETHSRTVAYDAGQNEHHNEALGEFVSCKTLTSGNRTVETYTYKTERDGIIETHVEHRVTIHSDEPIDHDAELSHAIMEATQMNPDMTVEKIEVRQESTA